MLSHKNSATINRQLVQLQCKYCAVSREQGPVSAGKAADVKRCYAMRKALALLDFDSESIADVKRLLLRAAFLPAFLRTSEGRRFLAYLFTLEVMTTSVV